jgi:hypothetical protein
MKERIGQGLNIIEYEEWVEIRSLICEMGRRNKKGEMWIESLSGRTIQGHRQRDWMWRLRTVLSRRICKGGEQLPKLN